MPGNDQVFDFRPPEIRGRAENTVFVRVLFALVFPLFIFPAFPGCRRSASGLPVVPPVTHPLARDFIGYGVVSDSFAHFLNEPGTRGVSQGYLRRGTVVRVIERRQTVNDGSVESWVLAEGNYAERERSTVSRGWLRETTLEIYDNESQAMTASKAAES